MFLISRVKFFRLKEIPVRFLWAGYFIKLLAGITVGLIYTYYYTDRLTADTFRLFDDSKIIFETFFTNQTDFFRMISGIGANSAELDGYYNAMNNWYDIYSPINDNRTMIRFNALLHFISLGNYYVHVVIISFLSFTGVVGLVKVFEERYPHLTTDIFGVLILLPSLLLWVSGLLKDSLAFFTFGMTIYFFSKILRSNSSGFKDKILLMLFLLALMFSKFQIFLLCMPLLSAWYISEKSSINPWIIFPVVLAATAGLLYLIGSASPSFDISAMLSAKQQAFYDLGIKEKAGSLISIPRLEPHMNSIMKNAPAGFFTALFRPLPFDPGPLLSKLFTIENLFVIGFIFWNLYNGRQNSISRDPAVVFCLFYAVVYLSIIGMVTPVLGAMVRYKAQALPFLIIWAIIVNSKSNRSTTNRINKFLNRRCQ
jgi:hypothetical protein